MWRGFLLGASPFLCFRGTASRDLVVMWVLWCEHLCVEYNRVFGGAEGWEFVPNDMIRR